MAKQENVQNDWAACVGKVACAGWWTLLVGVIFLLVSGVVYMVIVHTPFLGAVAMIWGVGPKAVMVITVVFMALFKLFLLLWLFGCVFLTVLAHRLRAGEDE